MSRFVGHVGFYFRRHFSHFARIIALLMTTLWVSVQPRHWPGTVRNVLTRQILFTGVESTRFICVAAVLCGVSVVVQAQVWLTRVGQSKILGPLLVAVVVRQLGPLLTNLIVIGRSGTAIASELASMRVARQVVLLDTQGVDPFTYLVMPRILGVAVAVFCQAVIFTVVCLCCGFLTSAFMGGGGGDPILFASSIAQALRPVDVLVFCAQTLIPGLLMGAICCDAGLAVDRDMTEIPRATTLGQVRSLMAVFITFLVVSLMTYL